MPTENSWRITFLKRAQRDFRSLDHTARQRILDALEKPRDDPYTTPNVKRMKGQDAFRFRVGDYRILYTLRDAELVVEVIRIGNRREVYR